MCVGFVRFGFAVYWRFVADFRWILGVWSAALVLSAVDHLEQVTAPLFHPHSVFPAKCFVCVSLYQTIEEVTV